MHTGEKLPQVGINCTVNDALMEMTRKGFGLTAVLDESGLLCGIYTDGDLRRTIDRGMDPRKTNIREVMTTSCKTIKPHTLAVEAVKIMETYKITALLIVDEHNEQQLVGIIHLHDLLRSGVI